MHSVDIQSCNKEWHSRCYYRCWIKYMWLILLRNKELQKNSELMTTLSKFWTKRFDHTWKWFLVAWGQAFGQPRTSEFLSEKTQVVKRILVLVTGITYSKTLCLPFLAFGKNILQLWLYLWDVCVSPTTQEYLSGEPKSFSFEIKSSRELGFPSL